MSTLLDVKRLLQYFLIFSVQNLDSNSLNEAPKITKDKDVLFVGK